MDTLDFPLFTVGVDEAGRGPLAGPVIAAAVMLNPEKPITGLKDSKLLSSQKREKLFETIQTNALGFGIGQASVEEIDHLNILWASMLAMERAVEQLPAALQSSIQLVIIDGNRCPKKIAHPVKAVIQADKLISAVSAASILAKVTRDKIMQDYHTQYPQYQFDKHKGYPTPEHKQRLLQFGLSDIHRKSFRY